MKRLSICFIVICLLISCSYAEKNVTQKTKQSSKSQNKNIKVKNLNEIDDKTLKKILQEQGPLDYFPNNISIIKFGTINNKEATYHIIITTLIWGNARMTKRLVILSDKLNYLGNFRIYDNPTKIKNYKIIFPYANDDGNEILLNIKKIPEKVFLDGEDSVFDASLR